MRRPTKIGSAYFYSNRASDRKKYKGAAIDLLLHDQSIRNPGSYFAYAKYDRFYKFFSSTEFVELEKKRFGDASDGHIKVLLLDL
jgi:hypothetical protein